MYGLRGQICSDEVAVVILHGVKLVELAAGVHQVARESDARPINLGDQRNAPLRMPWRRQDEKGIRSPGERLVILKRKRDRQVLSEAEEGAPVIVVIRNAFCLPVVGRSLKEVALMARDSEPRSSVGKPVRAEALVAVMVGEKDPVHSLDADTAERFCNSAASAIHEEGAIVVAEYVNVASVFVHVQVWQNTECRH